MVDRRFVICVQMRRKPPFGLKSLEQTHERRRSQLSVLDVFPQVPLVTEQLLEVSIMLNRLRPIMRKEYPRRRQLKMPVSIQPCR